MKRLAVLSCLLAVPPGAMALGIRLLDHDAFAVARGDAFVATADNPSAIYYNPAGISQLTGHNVRGAVHTVNVKSEFEPTIGSGTFETKDEAIPLPGIYYVYAPTNLPISFGAAYYLPYGLRLEWPDNSPFRTVTTKGSLEYDTLSGVISWQVCRCLSIAGGPTINYAKTKLERGIAMAGDRFVFEGDDIDLGATAGLLWQATERHSFGVSYRSQTTMNFSGHSRVTPYPLPEQNAEVEMKFPQVVIAGYSFRPTKHWNLEVDIDWTDWDKVNTLVLQQKTGNILLPLQWRSSWAFEFGATRYFDNGIHVSAGYVYNEDATPTRTYNPLVPDQDLHVFSGGVGGQIDHFTWDAAYQFSWGPGRSVSGSVNGPAVAGDYTFAAHSFTVSLGWHF